MAGPGSLCNHLIIVATSGGAYRSGYWTAAVLDEIESLSGSEDESDRLRDCIRLITGASGGMVGAAYYVAMRNEVSADGTLSHREVGSVIDRLNTDTHNSRLNGSHFRTRYPYARDSLTPVVQQLVQRDIFHVFSGKRRQVDRGLVLEEQWTTLDLRFEDLRGAEAGGHIPSLLVTPMAFSTDGKPFAQPLLISNLNVDSLAGLHWRYALPFFALFPEALNTFPVRTAIRMNATFPYVSPAVSLPTIPPARVVDAGYYENYGLAAAASWLFSARDTADGDSVVQWVRKKGLGVILIQIRAFPFQSPLPVDDSKCHARNKDEGGRDTGHGFQFLTTPIEAIGAVRESGMNIRNDQQIDLIKALLDEDLVHAFSFENTTDAGMSWYLTPDEVACLKKEVHSDYNRGQWGKLRLLLTDG